LSFSPSPFPTQFKAYLFQAQTYKLGEISLFPSFLQLGFVRPVADLEAQMRLEMGLGTAAGRAGFEKRLSYILLCCLFFGARSAYSAYFR
jgi:hypothetical protein